MPFRNILHRDTIRQPRVQSRDKSVKKNCELCWLLIVFVVAFTGSSEVSIVRVKGVREAIQ
jgi:hypothetical protein